MERNIGFKERRYIEELRILTKSTALDCVIDERFCRVIYVVKIGDMGLAIGKKEKISGECKMFLENGLRWLSTADSMNEFVTNIFRPAEIDHIQKKNGESQIDVFLKRKNDLGIAIGKGGCNIEKARILLNVFSALIYAKSSLKVR